MDGFVSVYSKTTGQKHRVPEHWVDHPVLGRGISRTPTQKARDNAADTPSKSWNRAQLVEHATGLGLTPAADATKDDLLAAIAATTPQTPDGAPLPGNETPA